MRVFPLFDSRVTDRPTDRRTDKASYRVDCPRLKMTSKQTNELKNQSTQQIQNHTRLTKDRHTNHNEPPPYPLYPKQSKMDAALLLDVTSWYFGILYSHLGLFPSHFLTRTYTTTTNITTSAIRHSFVIPHTNFMFLFNSVINSTGCGTIYFNKPQNGNKKTTKDRFCTTRTTRIIQTKSER